MKLWIQNQDKMTGLGYTYVDTFAEAADIVNKNTMNDNFVSEVNIPTAPEAVAFLKQFDGRTHLFRVIFREKPTDEMLLLVLRNHWNKPTLDNRTTEIIMVLKGQHLLNKKFPEEKIRHASQMDLVGMYLSAACDVPLEYYQTSPAVISMIVEEAVKDYIAAADKPQMLLYDYFESKRMFPERTETEHWLAAFSLTQVSEGMGHFINGFTYGNTRPYDPERERVRYKRS